VLDPEPARSLPGQASLSQRLATARRLGHLLVVVLVVGGCSGVAEVTGTATQQDVIQLRADVSALQASVRRMKAQVDGLTPQDGRLRDRAVDLERQATALTTRLDGLATTVTGLSSRVEELTTRVEALNRQLQASAPPRAAPSAPASVPAITPAPAPSAGAGPAPGATPVGPAIPSPSVATATPARPVPPGPPASATPSPAPQAQTPVPATPSQAGTPPSMASAPPAGARPSTGALQPQDSYQAAYIDFSKGSYSLAITGFREFLRRYPEHPLAANAQYWIGEAQLALARGYADSGQGDEATRSLQQAVQEFRKVLANYPRGDKAPAALYKEALVLIELKQPQLAQARLQYLIDNFPQSEETPLARERLASLKDR
jgi:tol-pal system protein YbgF